MIYYFVNKFEFCKKKFYPTSVLKILYTIKKKKNIRSLDYNQNPQGASRLSLFGSTIWKRCLFPPSWGVQHPEHHSHPQDSHSLDNTHCCGFIEIDRIVLLTLDFEHKYTSNTLQTALFDHLSYLEVHTLDSLHICGLGMSLGQICGPPTSAGFVKI